jgi:hypothetical protein
MQRLCKLAMIILSNVSPGFRDIQDEKKRTFGLQPISILNIPSTLNYNTLEMDKRSGYRPNV